LTLLLAVIRAKGHCWRIGIGHAGLSEVDTLRQQQGGEHQPGDPTK